MRRWGYPVIVLGVALFVSLAWWSLSVSDLSRGAAVAGILAVPVAIIGWGFTLRSIPSGDDGAVDAVAARLIERVRDGRKLFLRQTRGVAWDPELADVRFTAPAPGESSPAIESLLVHWQQLDGDDRAEDTTASIVAFYRQAQKNPSAAGRLMITGAPGSGKSVLASKLVVDLLSLCEETGSDAVTVPVWLSLTRWGIDPKTPTADLPGVFQTWLGEETSEAYGLPARQVRALVKKHRVLPVLDGLDELDPAHAVAVVNALNYGHRNPVILTCRAEDYDSLAEGELVEARRPVLMNAKHITLRPLEPQVIDDFLTDALTSVERTRWANVIAAVHQKQPIAAVLASPLRLSFAYLAYRDAADPDRLLGLTENTAMTELLEPVVLAAVRDDPIAKDNGWTTPEVLHWLECLAVHQRDHAKGSEYDILLPDLWRLGGRFLPRYLLPAAIAAGGIVCGAVALTSQSTGPRLLGATVAAVTLWLAATTANPQSTVKRVVDPRTPSGRCSVRKGVVTGLKYGLGCALGAVLLMLLVVGLAVKLGGAPPVDFAAKLVVVLESSLVIGLVAGLIAGLIAGLAGEPGGPWKCSELMTQCLAYTMVVGLAAALAVGLWVWAGTVLVFGLVVGLPFVVTVVVTVGNGATWFRYFIGTTQAARRGVAPHRLASFLDWGLDVGLFRMSGYTLQFRHRDLYQALLTSVATPAIHEGESEKNVHTTP